LGKGYTQAAKTKGEVGTDGRLRLDVPFELPAGTFRTSISKPSSSLAL
jgi:hypothetical protein